MKPEKRPSSRTTESKTLHPAAKEFAHLIAAALAKCWQAEQRHQHNKNQSSQP